MSHFHPKLIFFSKSTLNVRKIRSPVSLLSTDLLPGLTLLTRGSLRTKAVVLFKRGKKALITFTPQTDEIQEEKKTREGGGDQFGERKVEPSLAMAHYSSSSSSFARRRAIDLDYEAMPLCYCGLRAPLWTSWSETNPDRRFFLCSKFRERGCRFFVWHDPQMCETAKVVINDLKRENKILLNKELNKFSQVEGASELSELKELVHELKKLKSNGDEVFVKQIKEVDYLNRNCIGVLLLVIFICISVMLLR